MFPRAQRRSVPMSEVVQKRHPSAARTDHVTRCSVIEVLPTAQFGILGMTHPASGQFEFLLSFK
jgi:hypothetical protein